MTTSQYPVPVYGQKHGFIRSENGATVGATIGTNVYNADGSIYAPITLTATVTDGDTTHAPTGDAVFDALALKAALASPAFTGNPTAPTPLTADNGTSIATTAFVKAQGYGTVSSVNGANSTGITWSGGPITTSGSLTATLSANLQSWHAIAPSTKVDVAGDTMTGTLTVADQIISTGTVASLVFRDRATANEFHWYSTGDIARLWANGGPGDLVTVTRAGVVAVDGSVSAGGIELGYRDIPRVTGGIERGKVFATAAGLTVNTGQAAGSTFTVYNNSAAAITLTQGAGLTMRLAGTATTGSRTLAVRGFATIWYNSTTEVIVTGNVT